MSTQTSHFGKMKNKGVFFSTDALIALSIIILVVAIAIPLVSETRSSTNIHRDVLKSLSSLKMNEIDPATLPPSLQNLTSSNKSLLDQIGELYLQDLDAAKLLASTMLSNVDPTENIGMWFANTLIWSQNTTSFENAQRIDTARLIISGIQNGTNVTGFSARAFLSSSMKKQFFYFGGFVGNGNLTARINYTGNISSANIELTINRDFELYINGIQSGSYAKSVDEFTPVAYNLQPYLSNFQSGTNDIEFRGDDLSISGGFLKITYENKEPFQQRTKYIFPGVEGLINIYDGFYIPGTLDALEIFLHMNSSQVDTFLNIGNVTILDRKTTDEELIILSDSTLSSLLNYTELSGTTIPLRLGLRNVSFINISVDLISASDISKFMRCSDFTTGTSKNQCENAGGIWMLPANNSREAQELLIREITPILQSRIGIVGVDASTSPPPLHTLSNNQASLLESVNLAENEYTANQLRLCEAITTATEEFTTNSNNGFLRIMVVMAAGEATLGCGLTSDDLDGNGIGGDPKDDAIFAACDAHDNHNITIHTVAFGDNADQNTLQQIASCGEGNFYFSAVDELIEIYQKLINDLKTEFTQQSIQGSPNILSKLFPDSYIKFTYDSPQIPFGLVLTTETLFTDANSVSFEIPSDVIVLEASIISYSGPRWTKDLKINGNTIYNLNSYGSEYISLGDPFSLNIPISQIGSQNNVSLTTGISPSNSSDGSASNKIILTVVKNASTLSAISPVAQGCLWHVQFEDNTEIQTNIPSTYSGSSECYYNVTHPVPQYDSNDAFQSSVFDLLAELDLDSDNKVDVSFTVQDLQISLTEVTGIPFASSTEVQVRIWSQ